jgi:threonine dehydratase
MTPELARAARDRIGTHVHRTPVLSATRIGSAAGVSLLLKCESLQKTGSFKARGALNAVMQLDEAARARGVIAVSAGNHAQALGWAATAAGVHSTVVMWESAPRTKVAASRGYGAEVILHGATSAEAFAHCLALRDQRGLTFVSPFDDPAILAGTGTVALELMEQVGAMDAVVIPVGGGGLLAGMAPVLRALRPGVRIYGVEPVGAAVMRRSLDAGRPVRLDRIDTIADGLSAPMAGDLTYPLVRDHVDDVLLVTDDEIRDAMRQLAASARLVAEPAGAAAVAAVMAGRVPVPPGARVVAVVSGGNVDMDRLAAILSP